VNLDDTIVAISSAVGPAGRMVIRASGPDCGKIVRELSGEDSKTDSSATARFLAIHLTGDIEFPAWIWRFRGPRSYTGQDLVEWHVPGNPLLARLLLERIQDLGARGAEPGEFTARAYFNGKMDLTQAEGVAAAVGAGGLRQMSAARQLMAGELSRRLRPIMDSLAETLGLVEVGIDFSEEGIEFLPAQEARRRVAGIRGELEKLVRESVRFEKLSHEPVIVLAGRPNAGKSTLTNALAGEGRSIVSPIAGTTRDALSVEIWLPRGRARLIDIAGLEETDARDDIARQMQEQASRAIESADVVVLVREVGDSLPPLKLPRGADLIVASKMDLAKSVSLSGEELGVSALTGFNMNRLVMELDRLVFGAENAGGATLALGARHLQAIDLAIAALVAAEEQACDGGSELLAADLREALDILGDILGVVTPDDVLGRIFATFCIGK
jgi:tRNA modification GTPase